MSEINEGMVSLTDESVKAKDYSNKKTTSFRPQKDKISRIRIPSMNVMMRKRHYNPADKRYYRCLAYTGYCPACVAATNKVGAIKKASDTYGTNIQLYHTDDKGAVTTPLDSEVAFWAFGADKFQMIRSIIGEYGPIENVDLLVECTDPQFQKVSITPARNCIYNEAAEGVKNAMGQVIIQADNGIFRDNFDAKLEEDSVPVEKFLCKEVSVNDMVEAFNLPASYRANTEQAPQAVYSQQPASQQTAPQQAPQQYQQPVQQAPQQNIPPMPESNVSSVDEIGSLL